MKILGVDKNTPSAEGGFIEKAEDGTPTGYMEEADFVSRLKNIPMPGGEKLLNAFTRAQKLYFSHGIVTAQEGLAAKELLPLYRALDEADKLLMDVVLYPDIHASCICITTEAVLRRENCNYSSTATATWRRSAL